MSVWGRVAAVALALWVQGSAAAAAGPGWVLPPVDDPAITRGVIDRAAVGGPVSFEVALPDAAAREPGRCFPVLYGLHGAGGGADGVSRVALQTAIAAGAAPPRSVVFPNGPSHHLWSDAVDGTTPVETARVRELLPHVDALLPTLPLREAGWIGGFSRGGFGRAPPRHRAPRGRAATSPEVASCPSAEEIREPGAADRH